MRPKNIRNRGTINHVFDLDEYTRFVEMVGVGNASEELRAFIKDRIEGPQETTTEEPKSTTTLFMHFDNKDVRNELVNFINKETDMNKLNILYKNCKTVVSMVDKRKLQNHALAVANKRGNMKSNEEIERDVKEYRRRQRV